MRGAAAARRVLSRGLAKLFLIVAEHLSPRVRGNLATRLAGFPGRSPTNESIAATLRGGHFNDAGFDSVVRVIGEPPSHGFETSARNGAVAGAPLDLASGAD